MHIIFLLLQEETRTFVQSPGQLGIEQTVFNLVQRLKLGVELTGATVIGIGIASAIYRLLRTIILRQPTNYNEIRLLLSRFLALALEFQLGADILSTAIAPSWDQIGKLGVIALIRTALNYFLTREMSEERKGLTPEAPPNKAANDNADEIVK